MICSRSHPRYSYTMNTNGPVCREMRQSEGVLGWELAYGVDGDVTQADKVRCRASWCDGIRVRCRELEKKWCKTSGEKMILVLILGGSWVCPQGPSGPPSQVGTAECGFTITFPCISPLTFDSIRKSDGQVLVDFSFSSSVFHFPWHLTLGSISGGATVLGGASLLDHRSPCLPFGVRPCQGRCDYWGPSFVCV